MLNCRLFKKQLKRNQIAANEQKTLEKALFLSKSNKTLRLIASGLPVYREKIDCKKF